MKKISFEGRILVLGCGGVAQCVLPLLLKHFSTPRERITVLDMVDNRHKITGPLASGIRYVQEKITQEHYAAQLARFVGPGDLIIDLAWNISCTDLLDWCHKHEVLYINTSVELWDPYANADKQITTDRTLYVRQMAIRKLISGWKNKRGATAVLEHGANPGLVSHLTKMGLLDIGRKLLDEKPDDPRARRLQEALDKQQFNHLAHLLGVKVIHVSERDSQITATPKQVNEFVNTWSVEGFFEEGIAPAEMGWGTHEQALPPGARQHHSGPRNQICLTQYGMNTWVRSWVPCGEIVGMVIRHGEAFSISEYLTVYNEDGHAIYRPTVHYAYCPCDAAIASLHEVKMRNYRMQDKWRIMADDILSGRDELGCLLMGHDFKSWWIGSRLGIDEARRLVPGQNATTMQVAASIIGALDWIIRNPRAGVCLPEQLPHEEILEVARPYLGPFVSQAVDWAPGNYRDVAHTEFPDFPPSDNDPWQFSRFLVV
jgi:homospermidine synthase